MNVTLETAYYVTVRCSTMVVVLALGFIMSLGVTHFRALLTGIDSPSHLAEPQPLVMDNVAPPRALRR
jgi:hypothetical protein